MASTSRNLSGKQERFVDKCEREFFELKQHAEKYFQVLESVKEICQRAKQDVERTQLKAQARKEIAKRDAVFQANFHTAFQEMADKLKRMEIREEASPRDEKMPESARNAERSTLTGGIFRYVKISCALVFDAVAAYGLFKLTQPYF